MGGRGGGWGGGGVLDLKKTYPQEEMDELVRLGPQISR